MMKKRMLKRTGTWVVLIVFLLTTVLTMAGMEIEANAAGGLTINSWNTNPRKISPDDTFTFTFDLKNNSGGVISNVVVDLTSNANITTTSTGLKFSPAITDIPSGGVSNPIEIPMRFIGDGSVSRLRIVLEYKISGADYDSTEEINLNIDKPDDDDDDSPSTPFDPNSRKPALQATVGYNSVAAGSTNSVHINIKNVSSNTNAKNIIFSPVYEKDSPFVTAKATSTMPINSIEYGKSADMTLAIDVDKYAQPGIHPFTFKLTYSNSWNVEETKEFTVYLNIVNAQTKARINVYLPQQGVTAAAGGTFNLPLRIFNEGTLTAKDVRVTLTGLSQETFTLSSGTGRSEFAWMGGNETKEVSYSIRAASSLKSGSYPITVKVEYSDEKGNKTSEEQQVWIPVAGNEAKVSMLEILEIKPSISTVKPGESFDVSVKVKNSGEYDIRQIKVSADSTEKLLPVAQNLVIIPNLAKGETRSILFKFQPQHEAPRGGVPITIKVEPVDGGDGSAISQAISVFIDSTSTGGDEAGKNVPKIIVKSYSSEPTLVKAGEKFVLNMQFLNTHSTKTVRNIKGNFIVNEGSNTTGNVFTPVECSNTFYIDAISPKGTYDWTMTLYTIPDALSKTYTVNISFEYEDDSGNPYKGEELIGIPVYQPSRFEVSELSLPSETFLGQPLYVAFEMYNMGKTDIYNVRLNVEGDFEAQPKSSYFGNFESGRREYYEFNLIPMMPGMGSGRIIFQYETPSGELQEYVKEFSMNVMEMMMPPEGDFPVDGKPMPGMEEPMQKGFIGSVWFYVIIGVVVVGVVVTIILVRRKRKKSEEFDI